MCLLALEEKETEKHLSYEEFESAWFSNSDGFGIAICNGVGEQPVVHKTKDMLEAWSLYSNTIDSAEYYFIVYHFRLGTSGGLGENMLHPFNIGRGMEFFHNGVLPFYSPTKSDTALLADNLRAINRIKPILENEVAIEILESVAGTYNKFILCDNYNYLIINESAGHWKDCSWFSNSSYRTYSPKYVAPSKVADEFEDELDSDEDYRRWLKTV